MAVVPANVNTLALTINGKTFNLGVQEASSSYKVEEKDNNTKLIIAPDGTRVIANLNEKGQLVTKIINSSDLSSAADQTARLWGGGANGDSTALQGTVLNFLQSIISDLKANPAIAWLRQNNSSDTQVIQESNNNGESYQATATFYAPGQGDISMQGGTKDRRGKTLIGHRVEDIITKLKEFKSQGLSKDEAIAKLKQDDHYIGVAADHTDSKNKYGTAISINSSKLTERFQLNSIYEGLNFNDLHAKIVDTGGAFVGKGSGRLDIAMADIKTAYDIGKINLDWTIQSSV